MHNQSLMTLLRKGSDASEHETLKSQRGGNSFLPFTQERDSVGRLINNNTGLSILHFSSEVPPPLTKYSSSSRHSSSIGNGYLNCLKEFSQFQHSNHILQEIEEAVQRDAQKRKLKQKNLIGVVHDEVMKNILNKADSIQKNEETKKLEMIGDRAFNFTQKISSARQRGSHHSIGSNMPFLTNVDTSRHSVNKSQQFGLAGLSARDISVIQPLSTRVTTFQQEKKQNESHTSSPLRKSLIDKVNLQGNLFKQFLWYQKRKLPSPGIGLYDISNKDIFTLKRTQNIIFPSREQAEIQTQKLKIEEKIEKIEKKKVFSFYQRQKEDEKQKFIEHLVPKEDFQIVFPVISNSFYKIFMDNLNVFISIEENNRHFKEEQTNLKNREKLLLKTLNEKEDFPQEFNDKMNLLKLKAKRIRETILAWGDTKKVAPNKKIHTTIMKN